jgi:hypothetical protein
MAEEVHISPDGSHILVTSAGSPSLTELEQTLSRLVELRAEYGVNRILVDSRARGDQPSASDIYRGGQLLAETLGPQIRVAVLVGRIERDHSLFENVAVNRGALVAFFQSELLALPWLFEN